MRIKLLNRSGRKNLQNLMLSWWINALKSSQAMKCTKVEFTINILDTCSVSIIRAKGGMIMSHTFTITVYMWHVQKLLIPSTYGHSPHPPWWWRHTKSLTCCTLPQRWHDRHLKGFWCNKLQVLQETEHYLLPTSPVGIIIQWSPVQETCKNQINYLVG